MATRVALGPVRTMDVLPFASDLKNLGERVGKSSRVTRTIRQAVRNEESTSRTSIASLRKDAHFEFLRANV